MSEIQNVTWTELDGICSQIAKELRQGFAGVKVLKLYGVPRGGIHAAHLLRLAMFRQGIVCDVVEDPTQAHVIVDDLVDSGRTKERWLERHELFVALVEKQSHDDWIVFPWERLEEEKDGPADAVIRLLQFMGEDPCREGLKETPSRVLRSYKELFSGYGQNPEDHMKSFEDGACDEMVVLTDLEFYSTCEHHMQPFFGKAHLAYIPNERVIGVSKLARILEVFARRLQIQERLCQQWTQAIMDGLNPKGAACVLEAKHFCMVCRGVNKQQSSMITSSLTGAFKDDPMVRSEFLQLIRK